jgi:hypothetical protein
MEDNVPRFLCAALIAASINAAPALAQDSYPNGPAGRRAGYAH